MGRTTRLRWLALSTLMGCAGAAPMDEEGSSSSPDGTAKLGSIHAAASAVAALQRSGSCDDLLVDIQSDVATKIALQAELMREGAITGAYRGGATIGQPGIALPPATPTLTPPPPLLPGGGFDPSGVPSQPPSSGEAGGTDAPNIGTPTAPVPSAMGPSGAGSTGTLGPEDYSETNNQVEGVDEADIVKTDGQNLYVLQGNQLVVVDSWPAEASAVRTTARIEGSVQEMFVHEGVAAVFSLVHDQGDLVEQKTTMDASGARVAEPYYYGSPFTKITIVDVNAEPVVKRQLLIEGSYLSSRLHGTTVRAVVQGGFRTPPLFSANIEYTDPWGRPYAQAEIDAQIDAWRDRLIAAISETELADWLPIEREIVNGELTPPERRCTDFYAPSPALTDYGLTNIVSFDITDPMSALSGALILGAADEVYSNAEVMLLAHHDYRFDRGLIQKQGTILHLFALDGADTAYTASGRVPGHIVDQFSLDEQDGVVRVTTTAQIWQNFVAPIPEIADAAADADAVESLARRTDNRLLTLRAEGDELVVADATEPLGHDGETIRSTRFVGDRGYVVTFETTDPLVVVELGNPDDLRVLGQLEIPGFSEYMHPIDDDHLLTIGQNTDASGRAVGLMLQIFDVSDPTSPRQTHTYRFADGGYSEASVNHKAFTFHTPAGTAAGQGYLAFPYVNYSVAPFGSTLEVFHVGTTDGFSKLGAISHTEALQQLCAAQSGIPVDPGLVQPTLQPIYFDCVPPEVRRGLFVFDDSADYVYSVSHGGVLVHTLDDLTVPIATAALPYPDWSESRVYYGTGGAVATGGSTPPGTSLPPPPTTTPSAPTPEPMPVPPEG
jgi:hypothetical protein